MPDQIPVTVIDDEEETTLPVERGRILRDESK